VPTITFRCSEAEKIQLSERAEGNVSEFVRDYLFRQIDQETMLESILQRLDQPSKKVQAEGSGLDKESKSMLLELLLLMRMSVNPDRKIEAQEELQRLGYEVCGYDSLGKNNGR